MKNETETPWFMIVVWTFCMSCMLLILFGSQFLIDAEIKRIKTECPPIQLGQTVTINNQDYIIGNGGYKVGAVFFKNAVPLIDTVDDFQIRGLEDGHYLCQHKSH